MTAASPSPGFRLGASTLGQIDPGVQLPEHLRSAPAPWLHIGVGAFARAHACVYADDLLAAGHGAMLRGVSLRSRRTQDQLGPQDGLYTVLEREPHHEPHLRVIGSLQSVTTGASAAIDAIAAPATTFVTLTVTEKAYTPSTTDDPDMPTVLATGLARRPEAATPLVIAPLDNLADNGLVLREAVLAAADQLEAGLADRVAREVSFPCSVVDRIVPATTDADLEEIADRLGLVDLGAVVAEQYRSWVITRTDGLPPLEEAGVEVVDDIAPYQRRKLWLLNGPHSALAYAGLVNGCATIAEAATDPVAAPLVRGLVDDVLAVTELPATTRPQEFAEETLQRFANPNLGHTCLQVGADGSKKLPQRILPVVALAERVGRPTERFAFVVAAWIAAVSGTPVGAVRLPPPDDPEAGELRRAAHSSDLDTVVQAAVGGRVSAAFSAQVTRALRSLTAEGTAALARSV